MENLRNRINVKQINNEKAYLKCTSKPSYMSHETCIGMCILELRKVLMNKLHYDFIKNKYGSNSILLFTDTDTLMSEIKTEYAYKDLRRDK